jgi:hypothetical protein
MLLDSFCVGLWFTVLGYFSEWWGAFESMGSLFVVLKESQIDGFVEDLKAPALRKKNSGER